MYRATVIALVVIVTTAMGSSAFADGVSPWLPAPGAGFVNLSYVSQNATQFYVQDNLRGTPPQNAVPDGKGPNLGQHTVWLNGMYGWSDAIAIDFRVGAARSYFGATTPMGDPIPPTGGRDNYSGVTDANIGVTWRVVDELVCPSVPSIALRGGAIIEGSYTPGYIKMREILESGELGERRSIIAYSGGSALWGYTHAADMLLFLASDSPIEYVQGNVAVDDADFEDNRTDTDPGIVMGFIRFQNGINGISIPGTAYEFEVNCSEGTVRALNNGLGFHLRKRQGEFNEILEAQFPPYERKSGTVGCIEDIVEAIETDTETQGNIHLAHRSTEMVFAIVDSQRQQGLRVPIPMENRGLYLGRW